MNKWIELILGILFIVLGVFGMWVWRSALLTVIQGSVGLFVLLVGVLFFLIAVEDLKA
ncbi:MAG: hypothetical protein ACOCRX_00275 [Candidatus Woesearchaeota archaeon]